MWGAELLEALHLFLFRCWINSEHLLVHYITNCGYFGLIFLFNTAIFGVVAWKNCHLWRSGVMQGHCKAWKVALAAMGLFCLLGATWALSFLSYGSSSMPVLFLAAILNSLQGQGQLAVWLGRGGRQEEACFLPDTGGPGVPRHSHALPFSREQRDLRGARPLMLRPGEAPGGASLTAAAAMIFFLLLQVFSSSSGWLSSTTQGRRRPAAPSPTS